MMAGKYIFAIFLSMCTCTHSTHSYFSRLKRSANSDTSVCDDMPPVQSNELLPTAGCHTKSNQCLCEINGNCVFDAKSGTCNNVTDCTAYHNAPGACREAHCTYHCATGKCTFAKEIDLECDAKHGHCQYHCFDLCKCVSMNCRFTTDGFCRQDKRKICDQAIFKPTECGRKGAFYFKRDSICRNTESRGTCKIEKTIFALNAGGKNYTDSRDILFIEDTEDKYEDEYKIRVPLVVGRLPKIENEDDQNLFENIIHADTSKREDGRCITYSFSICEDGDYELMIKTMETFDVIPGEKTFNIKLGDIYIFTEVDIMGYAEERFKPVELVINFKVKNNVIIIDGLTPIPVQFGNVALSFCFGECQIAEGNFQIGAVSVLKMVDSSSKNHYCSKLNGKPWDCKYSQCSYNYTSKSCGKLKRECQNLCRPISKMLLCNETHRSLEMIFLLDSRFKDFKEPFVYSFRLFDKIRDIVDDISVPNSKYGIYLFNHWYYPNDPPNVHFQDPLGCLKKHLSLTKDLSIYKKLANINTMWKGYCTAQSASNMFYSFLVAHDKGALWTWGTCPLLSKIIVIITHEGTSKTSSEEAKYPAKADGTDSCRFTIRPAKEVLIKHLKSQGIALFVVAMDPDKNSDGGVKSYYDFLERSGIPHKIMLVPRYGFDHENIAQEIVNFAHEQLSS